MLDRVLRQLASLGALLLCLLFFLPSLEALVLRREVPLCARYPLATLVLAFALAALIVDRLDEQGARRSLAVAAAGSGLLLYLGSRFSGLIIDTSWDGLLYHQPGIYELQRGWNPYTRALDLALSPHNVWLNEYPRASWYASAVLSGVFADIEAAKLSFFLAAIAFVAALRVARVYALPLRWRGITAATLLVVNPVVIVQLWQFYQDGVLYYVLLTSVLFALAYARTRRPLDLLVLIALGTFLANVKFTGVVYFVALFGWVVADQLLWGPRGAWRALALAGAAWVVAVALTGFNPYLTHLLAGQHVFHPILGKGAIPIPHGMSEAWQQRSWLRQLVGAHVYFVRQEATLDDVLRDLLLDGGGFIGENRVDPRESGLGRYFWLAWLLTHLAALAALIRRRSPRLAFGALCLLVLSVLNPAAWWVRYVPLLWATPIVLGLLAVTLWPRKELWLPVGLSFYLLAFCAHLFFNQSAWLQLSLARDVATQRAVLVAGLAGVKRVELAVSRFGAHAYWLASQGYDVERLPEATIACDQPIRALTMTLCPKR